MTKNKYFEELMEVSMEEGKTFFIGEQFRSYYTTDSITDENAEILEIEKEKVVKITKDILYKFIEPMPDKNVKIDSIKEMLYHFIDGTTRYTITKNKTFKTVSIIATEKSGQDKKMRKIAELMHNDIMAQIFTEACAEVMLEVDKE
jgi:hypothetical protein